MSVYEAARPTADRRSSTADALTSWCPTRRSPCNVQAFPGRATDAATSAGAAPGPSLIKLDDPSEVADVVVAVVAAIGTVVVAFFGIHVAEAGRKDAELARSRSEQLHLFEQGRVRRLAAATDPDQRAAILGEDPPESVTRP